MSKDKRTKPWRIEVCRFPTPGVDEQKWRTYGLSRYASRHAAFAAAASDARLKRWTAIGGLVRVFAHGETQQEVKP